VHGAVVGGLDPGGEQPVQFCQVADGRPGAVRPGELGQELAADGAEEPLDLAAALGLTGQSKIILWITGCGIGC
jgi:hypothetical protein